MAVSDSFRDFVLDQLDPSLSARAKRMFGGYGLYSHDQFWGILHDDILWIRVDDELADLLRGRGGTAFAPFKDAKKTLKYYSVSADLVEDRIRLHELVTLSLRAGRAGAKRGKKHARTPTDL